MILLYSKLIIEQFIRLQAHGFSAEETRDYIQEHYEKKPCLDTIYRHRKSPIGKEMLEELIRQQERSILKQDTANPPLAMKYRSDLIGKMMDKLLPDLAHIESEHTEQITKIEVIWHADSKTSNKLSTSPKPTNIP